MLKKQKIFLSYKTDVEAFVAKVYHALGRRAKVECYFHPEKKHAGDFGKYLEQEIINSEYYVLFLSKNTESSHWQHKELDHWINAKEKDMSRLVVVNINDNYDTLQLPAGVPSDQERIFIKDVNKEWLICSDKILSLLGIPSSPFDDLPLEIKGLYEKDIISKYLDKDGILSNEDMGKGYPEKWPMVKRLDLEKDENPLDEEKYGGRRGEDSTISVDARHAINHELKCDDKCKLNLTFPEAGPREKIIKPTNPLRIAILVSGGIAPGINAIISSIIERHKIYREEYRSKINRRHSIYIYGCKGGFKAFFQPGDNTIVDITDQIKSGETNSGGSVIPTARADQLIVDDPLDKSETLNSIILDLIKRKISILYVIGGEGSMRAAHAISTVLENEHPGKSISVVGIPKTMDNDILWVWQSIGFLSAVEKARQIIIQLSIEVKSNPRVCVVQLFGSSSGYVVSHAALGSGVCDLALIPELNYKMDDVCKHISDKLEERRLDTYSSPYGLIVMAETAIPSDWRKYIKGYGFNLTKEEIEELEKYEKNDRRVIGQTPDDLRNAGLKIVSKVLEHYINNDFFKKTQDNYWEHYRVFTNEPRHIIRSIEPSVNDVAYGIRLGTMAVDMAMAGFTDCMISQWLTEYVAVPLKLVVQGRKKVPLKGIFWKNVISKTSQIDYPSLSWNADAR